MLACNIYVDNQEIIDYPVSYIMSNLDFIDQFMVYGGDDISVKILKESLWNTPKVTVININKKIKQPQDISVAQNKCMDHTFKTLKPDFLLSLQADIRFTAEGIRQILNYISNPNTTHTYFKIEHVKMYIKCGHTNFGAVLLNKECREKFTGDGAYMSGNSQMDNNTACLDIGYLSPQIWAKKLRQHGKTWNSPSALVDAEKYFNNKKDFITKMSDYVKTSIGYYGLLSKEHDQEWYKIIEDLDLVGDYESTMAILSDNV